ncbi:MAG: class I adenylate-forming enzyme family protein [Aliishimia sp.]
MTSVFDQGSAAPCPSTFNMAAYVLAHAAKHPDKTALSVLHKDHTTDWTFAQINAAVRGIAQGFLEAGLQPGQRILLRLGNRPEYPLAYLAAIAVDLIPIPTSPQLTEKETQFIIDDLAPEAILHEDGVACPPHSKRIDIQDLTAMMLLPGAEFTFGPPDRAAYIVYTSGTSGKPRAVLHAHRAIWARRMMHDGWYGLHHADRMLHAGAFNWTYTMGTGLMDPWSVGATALIPSPNTAPDVLPGLMARHNATLFAAAPGVYRKFLKDDQKLNAPALRHGLSAGEKMSPAIQQAWTDASGTRVLEAYGLSECSTFISAAPKMDIPKGATGRPQHGRKIALLDAHGMPVPIGTAGTIAVHKSDPGLMIGYVNAATETAQRFSGDWFVTGDQAQMDAAGYITYLGRNDDMMNAGGFRVSPLEVEASLNAFPGIEAIAVTDVEVKPDLRVIMAFYTGPKTLDHKTFTAFASDRLAAYKVPRDFIHVAHLPTGANGKLARAQLQRLWRPHDQT